jgi:hypothetical protein
MYRSAGRAFLCARVYGKLPRQTSYWCCIPSSPATYGWRRCRLCAASRSAGSRGRYVLESIPFGTQVLRWTGHELFGVPAGHGRRADSAPAENAGQSTCPSRQPAHPRHYSTDAPPCPCSTSDQYTHSICTLAPCKPATAHRKQCSRSRCGLHAAHESSCIASGAPASIPFVPAASRRNVGRRVRVRFHCARHHAS